MRHPFETVHLTKRFDDTTALDGIDLTIRSHSIVGLLGRNGSGKTTLMHHLMGLQLPSEGSATTLGRRSDLLTHEELTHIGWVPQEIRLLDWMTVEQHLAYVATFYPKWDVDRQARLVDELELELEARVGSLSTGNLQKLAVLLAVCHHPTLLVLDEPVSDLDPIVRGRLLEFLLEVLREDEATILISSHVLRDVEKIVDWVICLERGRLVTNEAIDDLKERYAEWRIVSRQGDLTADYSADFVLAQELGTREGRLLVDKSFTTGAAFQAAHDVDVTERPLNLEEMFPLLVRERER